MQNVFVEKVFSEILKGSMLFISCYRTQRNSGPFWVRQQMNWNAVFAVTRRTTRNRHPEKKYHCDPKSPPHSLS
ncbi:hypothetical protein Avbf_06389 [Armadillidium vulgare]|nr:hypothetical protein Avbf_06389 [Armadillidium vulgare]